MHVGLPPLHKTTAANDAAVAGAGAGAGDGLVEETSSDFVHAEEDRDYFPTAGGHGGGDDSPPAVDDHRGDSPPPPLGLSPLKASASEASAAAAAAAAATTQARGERLAGKLPPSSSPSAAGMRAGSAVGLCTLESSLPITHNL
jgi:hypothetical protein